MIFDFNNIAYSVAQKIGKEKTPDYVQIETQLPSVKSIIVSAPIETLLFTFIKIEGETTNVFSCADFYDNDDTTIVNIPVEITDEKIYINTDAKVYFCHKEISIFPPVKQHKRNDPRYAIWIKNDSEFVKDVDIFNGEMMIDSGNKKGYCIRIGSMTDAQNLEPLSIDSRYIMSSRGNKNNKGVKVITYQFDDTPFFNEALELNTKKIRSIKTNILPYSEVVYLIY